MSTTFKELFPTIRVQWHFFATSHGKGAVDGVGATVKRAVNTDVLCRQAILVADAASFVASARKSCPNINIKLITSNKITDFIQHHKLNERWAIISAVPGTQSVHHMEPVSGGEVRHKKYSEAEQSGVHTFLLSEITSAESPEHQSSEHQSTAVMEDKARVTPDQVIETFNPNVDNRGGRYHFAEAVFLDICFTALLLLQNPQR